MGFALLSPLSAQEQVTVNQVNNVRLWHSPDKTRVVFDASDDIQHKVFTLKEPERLVVDIENASLKATLPRMQSENRHLNEIRSGSPKKGVLRFVFELKSPLETDSFVLRPNELYGYRLVLDLVDVEAEDGLPGIESNNAVIADAVEPKASNQAVVQSEGQGLSEAAEAAALPESIEKSVVTFKPDATVQIPDSIPATKVSAAQLARELVVAIDAGHGGEDPGAIGHKGSHEKKITLSIAKHLHAVINGDSRMTAFLIRDGDYYVDLTRRRTMAKERGADIFVSIHADAFRKKSANGLSVFALSQRGATSAMAGALAKKENAADLIGGVSLANKDEVLKKVLVDLSMSNTISESVNLGGRVLKELAKVGRLHSKRVEQASFVVLKSPDIPSILVETGFITNLGEEKKLRTSRYQKKIANAIHTAIGEYYEQTPHQNFSNYSSRKFASITSPQADRNHRVKRGDSLSSIALAYGTSVSELKRVNNLRSDTAVLGKKLKLPSTARRLEKTDSIQGKPTVHIVRRGDSLSKISARYNVTINALKRTNGLTKDSVYTSQKLIIPGHSSTLASSVETRYKVARGDTLSEIAEKYGVTISSIVKANRLRSRTIRLGQILKIPG